MKKRFLRVTSAPDRDIYLPYWKNKMSQWSMFNINELFTESEWARYMEGCYGDKVPSDPYVMDTAFGVVKVAPVDAEEDNCYRFFGVLMEVGKEVR